MPRIAVPAACLIATVTLGGCQEQRTVVVAQAQAGSAVGLASPPPAPMPQQQRRIDILAPCSAPAHSGPFERLPPPVVPGHLPKLARADAEQVTGCAGVRFRVGPDGAPRDITVMADYPVGYGFGDAGAQAIAGTRWSPMDDLSWRYARVLIRPHAL